MMRARLLPHRAQRSRRRRNSTWHERSRQDGTASLLALAVGAAHELAGPLCTIGVAARELERGLAARQTAHAALLEVGFIRGEVERCKGVLPGVRFACDAYVELVRERSLLEAVASSLTELVAPELMSKRIAAWEQHYPWVRSDVLAYFRTRVPRARTDSQEALAFVTAHATTRELQERCVAALVRKTEILWHLLDCVAAAHGPARPEPGSA